MTERATLDSVRDNAGYIAAALTGKDGGVVTLYLAEAQGIDPHDGGKYMLVCETHGTNVQMTNKKYALGHMRHPDFCDCCKGTCRDSWSRIPCPDCGHNPNPEV